VKYDQEAPFPASQFARIEASALGGLVLYKKEFFLIQVTLVARLQTLVSTLIFVCSMH